MLSVDRILFPTDGSASAERAHSHAQYLADHFDATLHVITVDERDVERSDVIDIDESDVRADLHDLEAEASPLPVARVRERTVTHPAAAGGILNYAVQYDVDLIVIGTHGHRGVRRLLLGSVAEEVLRKAPCPVVTMGRGAVPPGAMEGGPLLVPVDFSEHRFRLLAYARELAPVYDLEVLLLHVVEMRSFSKVYGHSAPDPAPGHLADRARQVLNEEGDSLRDTGIDVRVEVRAGQPAAEVLDLADEIDTAYLLIATHGRTGLERMLMGSVAEKVIRQAPCPVFTVKSFGHSLVTNEEAVGA